MHTSQSVTIAILLTFVAQASAGDIAKIVPDVLDKDQRAEARGMIDRSIRQQLKEANTRHREEWYKVKTREQWEKLS